jgi:hypothetical protein
MNMGFKKALRLTILAIITIVFIIVAGIAVILAQGNTIDDSGGITQTSIISINSIPTDTDIFIDNEKVNIRDNKVEWILPGSRNVRISKEGYRDWSKDVVLEAGIVKNINLQLYPKDIDVKVLSDQNLHIDNLFFSRNSDFAYYFSIDSKDATKNGLWKLKLSRGFLDFGNNSPTLVSNLDKYTDFLLNNRYTLTISNDNNKAFLSIPEEEIILILDLNRVAEPVDLTKKLGYYPDNLYWFRDSESLVVEKSNLLIELELSSEQKTLIDYSFEDTLLYSVNHDFVVYKDSQHDGLFMYSNKSSTDFRKDNELIKKVDLANLKSIYSVLGSRDILVLHFNNNSVAYINLDKIFLGIIEDVKDILSLSSGGESLIFEKDNGTLSAYKVEPAPNNLDLKGTEYIWDSIKASDIESIIITQNSRSVFVLRYDDDNNKVITAFDLDGLNSNDIIQEDDLITFAGRFAVSSDSIKIFILGSQKGTESETKLNINNILEIDLQVLN